MVYTANTIEGCAAPSPQGDKDPHALPRRTGRHKHIYLVSVDLGVVSSFQLMPDSVCPPAVSRDVNPHRSLLPAYRGPNGFRSLYEDAPRLDATVQRLTPEIDAEPILPQVSEPDFRGR